MTHACTHTHTHKNSRTNAQIGDFSYFQETRCAAAPAISALAANPFNNTTLAASGALDVMYVYASYYNMCPHTARLIAYCCHSFKAAKLAYNEGPGRRVNSCTHFVPSALTLGCKSTRNLQAGKRSLMHSRTRRCRNRCRCSSGYEGDVMQYIIIALHYNTHPLVSPLIACLTKSHPSSR